MGYKLLGYMVWQGAKWYMRRRGPSAPSKAPLVAGVAGVVLAGGALVAVQRRSASR
jgi:hypothetical protein